MIPLNHIYYHYLDWKDKALTARMFNCSIELVNEAINRYTPEVAKEPKLFSNEHYINENETLKTRAADYEFKNHFREYFINKTDRRKTGVVYQEQLTVWDYGRENQQEQGLRTMEIYRDIYFEKLRLKNQ